ncbi:hypothetical protein ACHMW4_02650 [Mesorhizobium sp. UC22_110]|uniref:hypothetical protein n=1 Tax=unclassified Mesorhizobium TaxID=325217 RepID=UPI0036733420
MNDLMSLTALVFKGMPSVERQAKLHDFDVDSYTGEIIPHDSSISNFNWQDAISTKVQFGNISNVYYIKSIVRKVLKNKTSFLERLVLYSGSHAGDKIESDLFEDILREVDVLEKSSVPEAKSFASDIRCLVEAAIREGNPIVFV